MDTITPVNNVLTIDQDKDTKFIVNLTMNVTSVQLVNPSQTSGRLLELHLKQDATGGRTVVWPSTFKLASGAITLTAGANKTDVLSMRQVAISSDAGGVKYDEITRAMNQ